MKKIFKYSFYAICLIAAVLMFTGFDFTATGTALAGVSSLAGFTSISPSNKIQEVASRFGLNNLKKNQGTSRIIYDTLRVVPGQDYYYFFKECNNRVFPFTNLTKGNKLEVGESLTLLWGYLSLWTKDVTNPDPVYDTEEIDAYPKILLGEWSFNLGNKTICKPIRLLEWGSEYNKQSQHENNYVYTFNSVLSLMPLMEFEAIVRIIPFIAADFTANKELYMSLTLEGLGSILAPEETF